MSDPKSCAMRPDPPLSPLMPCLQVVSEELSEQRWVSLWAQFYKLCRFAVVVGWRRGAHRSGDRRPCGRRRLPLLPQTHTCRNVSGYRLWGAGPS